MEQYPVASGVYFPTVDNGTQEGWRFFSTEGDIYAVGNRWLGGRCEVSGQTVTADGSNTMTVSITLTEDADKRAAHALETGERCEISFYWLDEAEDNWVPADMRHVGRVSSARIENDVLTCEIEAAPFRDQVSIQRWTHEDQQQRYPGDRFFEFVKRWAERPAVFGWPTSIGATEMDPVSPVAEENFPPVIANPGNFVFRPGIAITPIMIVVTDADMDEVTVNVTGLPSGLTYNSSVGQVEGTPAALTGGATSVDFTATIVANDGINPQVESTFSIRIQTAAAANPPPRITTPSNQRFVQGEKITPIRVVVSDLDNGRVTVAGLPTGLYYDAAAGSIPGTLPLTVVARDYRVTITADDGVNDPVTATFTITVTPAMAVDPPPPVVQQQFVTLPAQVLWITSSPFTVGHRQWTTKRTFTAGADVSSSQDAVVTASLVGTAVQMRVVRTGSATITIIEGNTTYRVPVTVLSFSPFWQAVVRVGQTRRVLRPDAGTTVTVDSESIATFDFDPGNLSVTGEAVGQTAIRLVRPAGTQPSYVLGRPFDYLLLTVTP